MNQKLFFTSSQQISDRITESFDFVWVTATAQWNLRWQVDGYVRASPEATKEELEQRFTTGSRLRGANLRKSCIDTTWLAQQEQFAKFLLIDFCALYESWIEAVFDELGLRHTHVKDLQFPSSRNRGISTALIALQARISPELEACIYPTLLTNRKNSLARLENLLVCHRYFKECRNSMVHSNGIATQTAVDAYSAFANLTASTLGVTEVPQHFSINSVGDQVKLSLRGVVGYGEIVLKLLTTLDAELSKTSHAEIVFEKRWRSINGVKQSLPPNLPSQLNAIISLVKRLGLAGPTDGIKLLPLLRRRNLVLPI